MTKTLLSSVALAAIFASVVPKIAIGADFGSPDSVDNTLKTKPNPKLNWRESLEQNQNLTFGLDYQSLGLRASDTVTGGENNAAAGVFRFYGSWNLVGLDSGNVGGLVWKVEHRHKYTDLSPKEFSFIGNVTPSLPDGVGYVGMIGPAYSDQGSRLTNLYWKQKLNQGRTSLMLGYLDTTDYVDTYALASPWTGFTNLAFSTGGGAIGLPDDGVLGLAVGHMLTDNFYLIGGVADANGDSSDPFNSFFDDSKLFTTLEFGWTASQEQIYTDNVHVTAWNIDGGTRHNLSTITLPDGSTTYSDQNGRGINFSASYFATAQLMPFIRGGFSSGDVALYDTSISAGIGYFGLGNATSNLGFAVNWSEVNEAFGSGLDNQITSELYYNWAVNDYIQVTPDLQYIKNPAFSDKDSTWIIGLRLRVAI
ncbi:carbohydrate porin [Vibrio mediterranei]|uniref:carbohydrate porin n=1 Tax=Vibrio mediterranei TaxID=689 RepID=UPI0038CEAB07